MQNKYFLILRWRSPIVIDIFLLCLDIMIYLHSKAGAIVRISICKLMNNLIIVNLLFKLG